MQRNIAKKLLKNSFWLSLLLHLLLFFFSIAIILQPEENKKRPHYYVPPVPSYVYTGKINPFSQQPSQVAAQNNTRSSKNNSLMKKTSPSKGIHQQSMLAASFAMLQNEQFKSLNKPKNTEPILMIGDENEIADPLIKLIAKSLSAHFAYPKTEGMLGIKGRVLVEFTLLPKGTFIDIQMVQSSNNKNLDAAALYAANSAPTVFGADRFLSEPKHFVVGFVFY